MTASKLHPTPLLPTMNWPLPVATPCTLWSKDEQYRHSILIKRIYRDQPNQFKFRQQCHQTDIREFNLLEEVGKQATSTPPDLFHSICVGTRTRSIASKASTHHQIDQLQAWWVSYVPYLSIRCGISETVIRCDWIMNLPPGEFAYLFEVQALFFSTKKIQNLYDQYCL